MTTFELYVPEQGIPRSELTAEEVREWIKYEHQYWRDFDANTDDLVRVGQQNYRVPRLGGSYTQRLTALTRELDTKESDEKWRLFLSQARDLDLIIAAGSIGERLKVLLRTGKKTRYQTLAYLYSSAIVDLDNHPFGGMLAGATIDPPWYADHRDSSASRLASNEAREAQERSLAMAKEISQTVVDVSRRLVDLEKLYHEKLLLEGPSRHWGTIERGAKKAKAGAFIAFVALLIVPGIALWCTRGAVWPALLELVERTSGQFSVASILVLTIPVLAYAWLLKHVSRSYVQNATLEADARHRRVMALTFLGLAKRKTVNLEEADRALILNALFRPAPPNSNDEGPPVGLAEFLRTKP